MMRPSIGWVLLLCSVLACSSTADLTQIMVVVRSDLALDSVEIETLAGGVSKKAKASLAKDKLPRTLAVVRRGGSLGPVTITARGFIGTENVIGRSAKLSFVEGKNITLVLDLERACFRHAACKKDETCIAGDCESNAVDSAKLPDWSGKPGRNLTSGATVDGGPDASRSDSDAGPDAGDAGNRRDGGDAVDAGDSGDAAGTSDGCDDVTVDCDGDGMCETRIDTAEHCGNCNDTCELRVPPEDANATLSCATTTCVVACQAPAINLDGDLSNGCEFAGFTVPPAHVNPAAPELLDALAPELVVDCSAQLDFGDGALPADVAVCTQVVHPIVIAQATGPDLVVVPVTSLTVESGSTLTLVGSRPVVFLVYGDATIDGEIDASAIGQGQGPGGDALCLSGKGAIGASASNRGGGGGGGSFGTLLGAKGGNGYSGGGSGGMPGMSGGSIDLTPLVGGCPGGSGGTGQSAGGLGGGGGGAIQISASGNLTMPLGAIAACGGGGRGAATGNMAGGGGGGSGGAVLLEATTISVSLVSTVTANGGGGGEASSDSSANPGANGMGGAHYTGTPAAGGSGGANQGGDGGNGAAGMMAATAGANGTSGGFGDLGGGGGGGGGTGRIVLRATSCSLQGAVSPAAVNFCSL
jgi:hypothetical protein